MTVERLFDKFNDVLSWLKELGTEPVPEEEIPDIAGVLNQIRAEAQGLGLNLRAEAGPYAGCDIYKLVPDHGYTYSFNVPGIIGKRIAVAQGGMTLNDVMGEMVMEGVFGKPTFKKLQAWAERHDVGLTVVNHEITDDDIEGQVGRHRVDKPHKIETIEKGT